MIVHPPQMMIVELPVVHVMTVANKAQKADQNVTKTSQEKIAVLNHSVQIPVVPATTVKFYN